MKNFEAQLFPERNSKKTNSIDTIYTNNSSVKKLQANIDVQVEKLSSSLVLCANKKDDSLFHLFNNKKATPEQKHDLINFRKIGQMEFERRAEYYTLRHPSVRPPKWQKRLATYIHRKKIKMKKSVKN